MKMTICTYHGTTASVKIDTLNESCRGTFGAGVYTGDLSTAKEWADEERPNIFKISTEVLPDKILFVKADYDVGELHDLETPALPLISFLYNIDTFDAAQAFNALSNNGHLLGAEIKTKAFQLGYEAIYADYGQGHFEFVIINENIIRDVTQVDPINSYQAKWNLTKTEFSLLNGAGNVLCKLTGNGIQVFDDHISAVEIKQILKQRKQQVMPTSDLSDFKHIAQSLFQVTINENEFLAQPYSSFELADNMITPQTL